MATDFLMGRKKMGLESGGKVASPSLPFRRPRFIYH